MMTLEQIGLLAISWNEAEENWERRRNAVPPKPYARAAEIRNRRMRVLRGAIRHYKLLEEAKGKGVNDGTV